MKIADIEKIIEHFGHKKQEIKAIEEMSELTKELCKKLLTKGDRLAIIDEIADVSLMLMQLILMYGCEELVEKVMDEKIFRTLKYIEELKGE